MARSTNPATTTTDPGGTNDPAGPGDGNPSDPWDDGGTNDPTPGKKH
jgi:hypothetical protein